MPGMRHSCEMSPNSSIAPASAASTVHAGAQSSASPDPTDPASSAATRSAQSSHEAQTRSSANSGVTAETSGTLSSTNAAPAEAVDPYWASRAATMGSTNLLAENSWTRPASF